MPALIDKEKCRGCDLCFPQRRCQNKAITVDQEHATADIDWTKCSDCPGLCTNFCDYYAIRYNPDEAEFKLMKAELQGEMSPDEIAEARLEMHNKKEAEKTKVLDVDESSFAAEVLQSELPVVVDFWATWCEPCKTLKPVYEQLAKQYDGALKFVRIDVDQNKNLAQRAHITNVPTLLFFYQGQVVDGAVGALPPEQLQSLVYNVLTAIRAMEEADTEPELGL